MSNMKLSRLGLFHLVSHYILGKVNDFQRISSKALRSMDKNIWEGGLLEGGLPGLNRVKGPYTRYYL